MPPVNRKGPGPRPTPRRRPAVAGTRARPTAQDPQPQASTTGAPSSADIDRPDPSSTTAESPSASAGSAQPASGRPRQRRNRPSRASLTNPRWIAVSALVALMLVAAIVLAVTSMIHNSSGDGGDTANAALVDQPATQEVNAAAANVLKTAYTYSHTTLDADFDAAVKLMTPEMANQYNSNRDNIRKVATQAKTTTSATVVSNGVRLLSGDRAEVIAFVVINADNNGQALQASGYRFTANLLRDNGQWLLSGLTEA